MPVGPDYRGLTTTTGERMPVSAANSPVTTPVDATTQQVFNATANNGWSSSILGDATQGLAELDAKVAEMMNRGVASSVNAWSRGASRIETDFNRAKENILAQQQEGNRQTTYAQERLGGAVLLKRNVDDFTVATNDFTRNINQAVERLTVAKEDAMLANNQQLTDAIDKQTMNLYELQSKAYEQQIDVYYKSAQLALDQHQQAMQDLETLTQWAAIESPEDVARLSTETGLSESTINELRSNAKIAFNKKISSSSSSGSDLFTRTQLNKGAVTAGMTIDDFGGLEDDDKNFFINNATYMKDARKLIDDSVTNKGDAMQMKTDIADSNIPDAAKEVLTAYVDEKFPETPEDAQQKQWWQFWKDDSSSLSSW